MMEVAAVIQVRMGSTRLPGKALLEIGGRPLLGIILARLQRSSMLDGTIIATTDLPQDDVIADYCTKNGHRIFRGDAEAVLLRYIGAADRFNIEHLVRVTGDNPLTDVRLMDELISLHLRKGADYSHCRGFPLGTATEVVRSETLRSIYRPDLAPNYREHVTLFFHDHPSSFKVTTINNEVPETSTLRLTVDTERDLELMRALQEELVDLRSVDTAKVLELLIVRSDLRRMNSEISQKDPWKR